MSETKYVAMSHGSRDGVWIQKFLNKLLSEQTVKKIEILSDNETSFTLIKDMKSQNYTKHINVMYHHVRGLVQDGELRIEWISNSSMFADGLTKVLIAGFFKGY